MALPSPLFTVNAGAPGVKASVAAGATVTCTLDDTTGVTYVEWAIIATDETTAPGDYTLSTSGGVVPGNETVTFTAGIAGTSGIVRAKINHGVNSQTGNASTSSDVIATAKWYVPTSVSAFEVIAAGEEDESDATYGMVGEWNQALRTMGGGGPGAFTYIELGSGTKPTSGLIRVATAQEILTARTTAAANNRLLTDDGADGLVVGNATVLEKIDLSVAATKAVNILVGGASEVVLSQVGVNIASGNFYYVNGVAHDTAAVASSLAFRGASSELSVGYLYSAGTVSTTGFIRLARNFTAIACKTAASTDHPILVEDNADGFVWGSPTLTANQVHHVKTGGAHTFEINDVLEATINSGGIALASGNLFTTGDGGQFGGNGNGSDITGSTEVSINLGEFGSFKVYDNTNERWSVGAETSVIHWAGLFDAGVTGLTYIKTTQYSGVTTDATVTSLASIAIPDNSVCNIHARLVARSGASTGAGYERVLRVKRFGAGVATIIGAVATPFADSEDTAGWDATIDVDGGNNARVRITGAAATTILWSGRVEVIYNELG